MDPFLAVSPSNTCYNETINTLRFGQRAKKIISHPVVNEDPKERTIRELRAEIARLKELLAQHQVIIERIVKFLALFFNFLCVKCRIPILLSIRLRVR